MIKLEQISKRFKNKTILKDISCEFKQNETAVIIGPSGSGKTTLLRCINRLDPADKGQVLINGNKITKRNEVKLCQKIGMVFQQFNLFPHMTVLENLIYTPVNVQKISHQQAITMAEELLNFVNLTQKKDQLPASLSGGQKQRIAICRALMMKPECILFDEPTSALDPESVKDIVSLIQSLKDKLTIIVVTHHINFAKKIADRIIFMDQGQLLADQPVEDFLTKPASHRARLFLETVQDF